MADFNKILTTLNQVMAHATDPVASAALSGVIGELSKLRYYIVNDKLEMTAADSLDMTAGYLCAAAKEKKFASKCRIFFGEEIFLSKTYPQYLLQKDREPQPLHQEQLKNVEPDLEGYLIPID